MPAEKIHNFWKKTRAELDEVEIDAQVVPVEETDGYCWRTQ